MRSILLLSLLSFSWCLRQPRSTQDALTVNDGALHTQALIFDLGMNDGADTENFLGKGFKVVAVEGNPFMVEKMRARQVGHDALARGDLKILNVGVKNDRQSSNTETLDFWVPDKLSDKDTKLIGVASFSKTSACRITGKCHAIKVPTITCSDLLGQEGTPFYLKIDIEGQDIECVKDIMEKRCGPSQLPQYVSFENYGLDTFASYYGEGGKVKELMELMHKRGYTGWKRARTWYSEYSINATSGLDSAFGEEVLDLETSNSWKPTSHFLDQQKLGCDVNCSTKSGLCEGWCDVHAKLDASLASC